VGSHTIWQNDSRYVAHPSRADTASFAHRRRAHEEIVGGRDGSACYGGPTVRGIGDNYFVTNHYGQELVRTLLINWTEVGGGFTSFEVSFVRYADAAYTTVDNLVLGAAVSTVPEPSTYALMAAALASCPAVVAARWWRTHGRLRWFGPPSRISTPPHLRGVVVSGDALGSFAEVMAWLGASNRSPRHDSSPHSVFWLEILCEPRNRCELGQPETAVRSRHCVVTSPEYPRIR
jgi:hypothetical protein